MSAFNFKTIIVKGDGIRKEGALAVGSADILPGQFVMRTGHNFAGVTNGDAQQFEKAVAVEQETFGTGIDEAYDTEGERVLYHVCPPGTEVFAWLAGGETANVGDRLQTLGAGNAGLLEVGAVVPMAVAMEAVDNSGSADPVRILVEIV